MLNFSSWSPMRAECYLTSNGCFARADQLRSINKHRRLEKGKKNRKSRLRSGESPRMSPAQLRRRIGRNKRVELGHPLRLSRPRGKDGTEIEPYFMENCIARCSSERTSLFPFRIFRVNRRGHYPAISDSLQIVTHAEIDTIWIFLSRIMKDQSFYL